MLDVSVVAALLFFFCFVIKLFYFMKSVVFYHYFIIVQFWLHAARLVLFIVRVAVARIVLNWKWTSERCGCHLPGQINAGICVELHKNYNNHKKKLWYKQTCNNGYHNSRQNIWVTFSFIIAIDASMFHKTYL